MLNSFQNYSWCPAWLMTQHMPSLPVGQSSTSWWNTTPLLLWVSGSLSPFARGKGTWLDGSLRAPLASDPCLLPLQPPALPHPGSAATDASLRAEMSRAACSLHSFRWKPGDQACWTRFWLAESVPLNMEIIRSVSCQVLGVAWSSSGAHTQDSCPSCAYFWQSEVAGSHFQI